MNDKDISLAQLQAEVDRWITTTGGGYFSPLTNMAVLTEEVGEVARVMARRYGDQVAKPQDEHFRLADELADVVWVVAAIANQTGIDLTTAFLNNLEKKNIRDKERFRSPS
ncbi:MAG: nucleotide pyrophosphohydrolase [Bacteroidales bacterium]|nr:nucleotide pyrophosphohydrolase [Bacteroidales bacterium]